LILGFTLALLILKATAINLESLNLMFKLLDLGSLQYSITMSHS